MESVVALRSSIEVVISNWNLVDFLLGAKSHPIDSREKKFPPNGQALDTYCNDLDGVEGELERNCELYCEQ